MKSALITGSSGFIGQHLIAALKKLGVTTFEFSRSRGKDLTDRADFADLPPVEAVFHLGAVSGYKDSNQDPLKAYRVNVLGTVNVLEYCRGAGAKMIFPSTYVYAPPYETHKKETGPARPTTHYSMTKYLGERLCRFYSRVFGANTLILRTSNVYGQGQTAKYIVPIVVKHVLDKKPLGLTKPGVEIWQELRGEYIYKVDPKEKETYKSISKVKTFTPASNDSNFIYAQLIRNLENACIKMRRYSLATAKLYIFLKTQKYESYGIEIKLNRPTSFEMEITPHIKAVFDKIFDEKLLYRQTGVILVNLEEDDRIQYSLFDDPVKVEKIKSIDQSVTELNDKFGKHSVFLGSTLLLQKYGQRLGTRGDVSQRKKTLLKGENQRQRLNLPFVFIHELDPT